MDRRHFLDQRKGAARRGIEWDFTFDEWVAWWSQQAGPNWRKKRGRGRGKYVMARQGDKGPYSPNNVKCILHEINSCEERHINDNFVYGIRQGSAYLTTEEVREVFEADGCLCEISNKYKAGYHNIHDIRKRRTRCRETVGLVPGRGCDCGIKGIPCIKGLSRTHPKS